MVISALVVTTDPRFVERECKALAATPTLSVGTPEKNRIPVVAETTSSRQGKLLFQRLRNRDDVWAVDVVMVDFSGEESEASDET